MTNAFMLSASVYDKHKTKVAPYSSQRGLDPFAPGGALFLFASEIIIKHYKQEENMKNKSQDSGEAGWDSTSYNGKYTYKN